jgi:hypothetical protein
MRKIDKIDSKYVARPEYAYKQVPPGWAVTARCDPELDTEIFFLHFPILF